MTTAADAIIAGLADAGVERIFGVVGTSTLDLADAIARESRLTFVSAREEEAAAHMADGYARASGRVGVVLAHVGPGALRQMYGVGTAYKDSVPMLVLTGNEVLRANDLELREAYHVIDVLALYRPITKATLQLRDPADARHLVARGLWTAASGRPGPVLLDLPKSSLKQEFDGPAASLGAGDDQVPRVRVAAEHHDVAVVAESVATAERPVILAGGGMHWSGAHDALVMLAEAHNLPVLTTDGGRGAIAEDHPSALGVVARQAGDNLARATLADSDAIVAIGTPLSDVSTFEWAAWSDDAWLARVDISPEVGHKGLSESHRVVADARGFLTALHAELGVRGFRHGRDLAPLREALDRERQAYRDLAGRHAGDHGGVSPWVLIDELHDRLPRDAFISIDSGMHSFYGKKLRVLTPRTYVRSAGFGAMGFSFPSLLGALEAAPTRRAVAIVGDGCLAMCLGEFETAARCGTGLTVVVCNDQRFASQQSHQYRRFDGRVIGTDFAPTDFVKIAEAQGVPGWTVADDDSARKAIRESLALQGPSVIDARLDRDVQPASWIEGSGDARIAAG